MQNFLFMHIYGEYKKIQKLPREKDAQESDTTRTIKEIKPRPKKYTINIMKQKVSNKGGSSIVL